MGFKIVHTVAIPGKELGEKLLEPLNATLVKGVWRTEDEIISNARNADAVIGRGAQPFTRRVIEQLSRCRIIACVSVGFEGVDLEAAGEHGIVVTNVPDYSLDEVSGRAIALMLALGYKLLQINEAVKERQLPVRSLVEMAYPIFRMRDRTLGIVGLGKIGIVTALKARGLGMRVIAYDPIVLEGVLENLGVKPVDFDTLLRESDFIILHTPLTSETRNMFGDKQFEKMKPTCYFINVSRGGCVDETALIRALQKGLIAGAGLDVTADETIAKDNPLLKMPNVILTGHTAWFSTAADSELYTKPTTQVVLALKGQWPPYAVNPGLRKQWLEKWG